MSFRERLSDTLAIALVLSPITLAFLALIPIFLVYTVELSVCVVYAVAVVAGHLLFSWFFVGSPREADPETLELLRKKGFHFKEDEENQK